MATRQVTTVFAVQGENDYRRAVQNINREVKEVSSQLKLLSEEYRGQEDQTEALRAKIETLTELYGRQAEKVNKVEEALANAQEAARKYAEKGSELRNKMQKNADAMSALAEAGQKASEEYQRLSGENKELSRELENTDARYEASERSVSNWKIKLNDAKTELAKTKNAMEDTSKALNDTLAPALESTEKKTKRSGESFEDFREKAEKSMDAISAAVAAAGIDKTFDGVVDAIKDSINKAIEFESAMTGVFKTVDMTLEEEAQLSEDIRDMAERIPVTTTEIAEVAELAGQLGISNEALLDFTETMVELGVSTDLTASSAAEALAKIANIAGTAEGDYSRLGSVIVALGNSFATTESAIVDMATRLAATGDVVGLSEAQIFAVATALSSVGIEAEAGGSAISKLLKTIETSVALYDMASAAIESSGYSLRELELMQANASKDFKGLADSLGLTSTELGKYINAVRELDEYAEISGQTAKEFGDSWGQDAVVALDSFITGLGRVDERGGNAVKTLEDMGITEVRLSNAVLALASSGGLLTETLDIANEAWEENTALTTEASKRFETTESKVQLLQNSFANFRSALGEDYVTSLTPVLEWMTEFVQGATEAAEATPALSSTLAGIGGGLAGLTGLTTVAAGIKAVAAALGVFGSAAGPAALAVTALSGLAAGTYTYLANVTEVSAAAQECIDKNATLITSYSDLKASQTALDEKMATERREAELLIEKISELASQNQRTAAEQGHLESAINRLNEMLPDLGLTYDEVTGNINLSRQAMLDFASTAAETAKMTAYEGYIDRLSASQLELQIQQELTSEKIAEARKKYDAAHDALWRYAEGMSDLQWVMRLTDEEYLELARAEAQADSELEALKRSQVEIQSALKDVNGGLNAATKAYDDYLIKINETAELSYESGLKLASRFAEGLESGKGYAVRTASSLVESVIEQFENSNAFGIGNNFASSFALGLEDSGPHVANASSRLAQTAKKTLETDLEIRSPSKIAIRDGRFFGEGLALGLEGSEERVAAAVRSLATKFDISNDIAEKFGRAQSEIGRSTTNLDLEADRASYYDAISRMDRAMNTASRSASARDVPRVADITIIQQLDGKVLSREVSRVQWADSKITARSRGVR